MSDISNSRSRMFQGNFATLIITRSNTAESSSEKRKRLVRTDEWDFGNLLSSIKLHRDKGKIVPRGKIKKEINILNIN